MEEKNESLFNDSVALGRIAAYAEFAYRYSTCRWWEFSKKAHFKEMMKIMNRNYGETLRRLL